MRLIDAEAILKQLYEDEAVLNVPLDALKFDGEALKEMLIDEKQTPTIDAIPINFINSEIAFGYEAGDNDLIKDMTFLLHDWSSYVKEQGIDSEINNSN